MQMDQQQLSYFSKQMCRRAMLPSWRRGEAIHAKDRRLAVATTIRPDGSASLYWRLVLQTFDQFSLAKPGAPTFVTFSTFCRAECQVSNFKACRKHISQVLPVLRRAEPSLKRGNFQEPSYILAVSLASSTKKRTHESCCLA